MQVEAKRALHDFQTAEVLGMSLREQLGAREADLHELGSRHSVLQAEQVSSWEEGLGARAPLLGKRTAAGMHATFTPLPAILPVVGHQLGSSRGAGIPERPAAAARGAAGNQLTAGGTAGGGTGGTA